MSVTMKDLMSVRTVGCHFVVILIRHIINYSNLIRFCHNVSFKLKDSVGKSNNIVIITVNT